MFLVVLRPKPRVFHTKANALPSKYIPSPLASLEMSMCFGHRVTMHHVHCSAGDPWNNDMFYDSILEHTEHGDTTRPAAWPFLVHGLQPCSPHLSQTVPSTREAWSQLCVHLSKEWETIQRLWGGYKIWHSNSLPLNVSILKTNLEQQWR